MPRIYASNNDPIDLCAPCFPQDEADGRAIYGGRGDGPDGRGDCFAYDAEHPSYDDDHAECAQCGDILTEYSDGAA